MVNGLGVKNLAEVSREFNISLIHISTDYIFSGESSRPYVEDDTPNPKNIYGESKLEGEIAMRDIAPDNSILFRNHSIGLITSKIIGEKNFCFQIRLLFGGLWKEGKPGKEGSSNYYYFGPKD